ncbi:MAG: EAL domain-containing protein [Thiogranum sp.]|nr:EAL domain-containing protein [Thiogranum sp.]
MTTPLRLLMVEDNEDDAHLLLLKLRRAGYEPDHMRVCSEANLRAALQDGDWQIVISDYAMPGFSGLEALRILKEMKADIPFILVSGTVGEEIAVDAMRKGANDYIMKDNLARLIPAIERELREARERIDRRRTEESLYQERERALVTLHSIGDGVITTDAEGCVDYMNPVAESVTGWTYGEAQGYPLPEVLPLVDEVTRELIESPAEISLRTGRVVSLSEQCLLVNRNGQEFHIEDSAAPIFDRDNRVIGAVLVFHDVTRERRMARQMTWQATHDSLTGLVNRNEFSERLSNLLAGMLGSEEREHALLYLDLDQFKVVNDTCGHAAGDELLKQLSRMLRGLMPANSALARLGGDEFGILIENVSLDQAKEVATQLLQAIGKFTFQWQERRFDVGASIGMVPIRRDTQSASFVLSAADVACYVAKEGGRNRVHVYEDSDIDLGQRHSEMHWVSRIKEALEENRLVLFRQEITSLNSRETTPHFELLVRMRAEDNSLVAPGAFIPAAERYNLMNAIDRWVIDAAFRYLRNTHTGDQSIYSINLSGNSINDEDLPGYIQQKINEYRIPPGRLCFEVTETAAVFNLGKASRMIHNLKKLGCRFSLDDFGSGLSSFGYLKNLPVDFLKIDGSFVKDMDTDPMNRAIVEAINQVGHTLSIRTIAEFVENEQIARQLRDIGVDFAQGYYFSKPHPLVESGRKLGAPA